jgi:hypothetical protein
MEVTWNTQPMTTSQYQIYLPPSTDPFQDYTDIDVTEVITKLFTEPENYHGLMLRLITEDYYRCLLFASSDYTDTIECRPKLEITYSICQQPVADFSYVRENLTIYFEDNSTYGEERWWDFGDGYYSDLSNPWHTYDFPGDYEVCLKTWNECGSDSVCEILFLQSMVKIAQNNDGSFFIYPNPASDHITITSKLEEQAELVIFDLNGRELIRKMADFNGEENVNINVSDLPTGIFFVRITSEKSTSTEKIIIYR